MAKPDELEELAQRYLDLFEAEDSAAAADPVLGEALDKITRAWIEAAQAGWALAPRVWNAAGGGAAAAATGAGRPGEGKSNDPRAAYGAAPPAAAPGSGTGELAALHARLDELESQLARLEPAAERGPQPDEGTGGGRS